MMFSVNILSKIFMMMSRKIIVFLEFFDRRLIVFWDGLKVYKEKKFVFNFCFEYINLDSIFLISIICWL